MGLLARLLGLLICSVAAPAAMAGEFKRGVNLNQWLDTYATGAVPVQSLRDLRAAGFDHVRLPVDPVQLGWTPRRGAVMTDVSKLLSAIEVIRSADLDVIVDMHPDHDTQQIIEVDPQGTEAFLGLWSWLAKQLRRTPADDVAIELLNEPQYQGVGGAVRWGRFQKRLLRTVRVVLPHHTVVITGRKTGTLDGLIEITPVDDPNVLYSFHFYAPSIFTHQGATWMRNVPWTTAGHWHDMRYPAQQARRRQPWIDRGGDTERGIAEMNQYLRDDWCRAEIGQTWAPLFAWARRYPAARIRLGEFGVIRANVEPISRYRWLADVRTEAEANGWGWTIWNYASDFGITTGSNVEGRPSGDIDPEATTALGLKAARR
ncbi:MAG TPA: cellulase family glycosylhydrolase [Stenotrophomonas sp.]|jgi:endoglucanase